MIILAPILLLVASTSSEVMDNIHRIPAGDWKFVDVNLSQAAARVSASYEVLSGSKKVRAALMLRQDLNRMSDDLPGAIVQTGEGRIGAFSDTIRRTGDYVIVLDNQDGKEAASVRLKVVLDFGPGRTTDVGRLTPRRRLVVVLISSAVFFGIVGLSARKLLQAIRR